MALQSKKPSAENKESRLHNVSSPIHSAGVQNPNEGATSRPGASFYEAALPHLDTNATPPLPEEDPSDASMANFAVNPAPFVPEGLEVEDWARSARGRIIVFSNPPRRHEDYAIVTMLPPPQQHLLYEAMDEVVDYFEEVHRVRVLSSCLSPLGLCLVQFRSPVA